MPKKAGGFPLRDLRLLSGCQSSKRAAWPKSWPSARQNHRLHVMGAPCSCMAVCSGHNHILIAARRRGEGEQSCRRGRADPNHTYIQTERESAQATPDTASRRRTAMLFGAKVAPSSFHCDFASVFGLASKGPAAPWPRGGRNKGWCERGEFCDVCGAKPGGVEFLPRFTPRSRWAWPLLTFRRARALLASARPASVRPAFGLGGCLETGSSLP